MKCMEADFDVEVVSQSVRRPVPVEAEWVGCESDGSSMTRQHFGSGGVLPNDRQKLPRVIWRGCARDALEFRDRVRLP